MIGTLPRDYDEDPHKWSRVPGGEGLRAIFEELRAIRIILEKATGEDAKPPRKPGLTHEQMIETIERQAGGKVR